MQSELTHMDLWEEAHHSPSGWMKYSVPVEIVTCLVVVTMAGELQTVYILKMLALSAMEQVCY